MNDSTPSANAHNAARSKVGLRVYLVALEVVLHVNLSFLLTSSMQSTPAK
jgi:hypothetical protein